MAPDWQMQSILARSRAARSRSAAARSRSAAARSRSAAARSRSVQVTQVVGAIKERVAAAMARGHGCGAGPSADGVTAGNGDQALPARPGAAALGQMVLRELVEAFPDGVLLADPDGTIVLASQRLTDMFGYSCGELAGRPVEVLIPPGLRAAHRAHRAAYARARRIRAMEDRVPLSGQGKDGTVISVEISLSPMPGPAGAFTLAVVRKAPATRRAEQLAGLTWAVRPHEDQELDLLDRIVTRLFRAGLTLPATAGPPGGLAANLAAAAGQQLDAAICDIRDHVFTAHADGHTACSCAPDDSPLRCSRLPSRRDLSGPLAAC
jgi:PAS domain S-box-containing protein